MTENTTTRPLPYFCKGCGARYAGRFTAHAKTHEAWPENDGDTRSEAEIRALEEEHRYDSIEGVTPPGQPEGEEDEPACGATFTITRNGTPTTYHCSLYAGHGGRHSQYN